MTVLHVSGAQVWGGNEQQLTYLINDLDRLGVTQKIFCFSETPLFNAVRELPIETLSSKPLSPYSAEYRSFFANVVKKHAIDIIHLHTSDSVTGYVVTDLIKNLKTPTLFARKGIRNKTSFLSKQKYNYKNIHGILCISEYVKKHFGAILSEKNKKKLVTVYNGVKVEDIPKNAAFKLRDKLNLSAETFLIGNIANHTNAKDLPTLVKVVDHLVNELKVTDFHLIQIGDFSKNTDNLKELVREKNLDSYITFMGFVENASSFLSQFNVFLMTSEREGGPSSIVEALYHKTPVISTKVGVVDEVIEDGVNGFTADVRDYVQLAKKIARFKSMPELSKQFSDLSYEIFLKKFTADQLGKNTLAVYQKLVRENAISKNKN
tara:strand:+ start:28405 stop:29535 length:1131 start_codon:yes stop_codon:yes gene_type:complete